MKFTIVAGTNRPGNLSLKVAKISHRILANAGLSASVLDLGDLPRDIAFDYLGNAASFSPFQTLVDETSHFVFVVPEYNASIPGILKLFIDACAYPNSFKGKSVALIGIAAGGLGNEPGIRHLDEIMRCFGAEVCNAHLHLANIRQKLQLNGEFNDALDEMAIQEQFGKWLDLELKPTTNHSSHQ